MKLNLESSTQIIKGALALGKELNTPPLTVAVLDEGGHLKAFARQDEASIMRIDIAIAKARGAIGMGMSSRVLCDVASERPAFMSALTTMAHGNLVPVPGGVLIRNEEDKIIGAVGITGDTSDIDEQCALAGIESACFRAHA
ncbi:heme-binding protein [Pseudoalteromonas sp. C2R02]|nr:heme-binding protein [Pseudoalteromonas sp. C2R02]